MKTERSNISMTLVKHKYYPSRKRARQRWRKTEHGKQWTRDYMREYRQRPEVKARYHQYYVNNKLNWGRIREARENEVYNNNENLHAENSERFTYGS